MRLQAPGTLLLLPLALIYALNAGGRLPWTLWLALLAASLLSAAWLLLARAVVQVHLDVPRTPAEVGGCAELRVRLRRRLPLPLPPLRVEVPVDGHGVPVATPRHVPWRGEAVLRLRLVPRARGRWSVGPARVVLCDPAGTGQVSRRGPEGTLRVRPQLLPPGRAAARLAAAGVEPRRARVERAWLAEPEPVGVRPWRPGDPPQHIDWKATARRGSLHVRELARPGAGRVVVAVDAGPAAREPDPAAEHAVALAASLARDLLAEGVVVGLLAAGDPPVDLPAEAHPRSWAALLDALTDLRPGGPSLGRLLPGVAARWLTQVDAVVVVTPRLDGALVDCLTRRALPPAALLVTGGSPPPGWIEALRARGIHVAVVEPPTPCEAARAPADGGLAAPPPRERTGTAGEGAFRPSGHGGGTAGREDDARAGAPAGTLAAAVPLAAAACAAALHPWYALLGPALPWPSAAELGLWAALGTAVGALSGRLSRRGLALAVAACAAAWAAAAAVDAIGPLATVDRLLDGARHTARALWYGTATPDGGPGPGALRAVLAVALGRWLVGVGTGRVGWDRALLAGVAGFALQWAYPGAAVPSLAAFGALWTALWPLAALGAGHRGRGALAATALASGALALALTLGGDRPARPWPAVDALVTRALPFARPGPAFVGPAGAAGAEPRGLGGPFVPDLRVQLRLRVEAEEGAALPPTLYLRMVVYTEYTGSAWRRHASAASGQLPPLAMTTPDAGAPEVRLEVVPEALKAPFLAVPLVPVAVEPVAGGPASLAVDRDLVIRGQGALGPGQPYRVTARLPRAAEGSWSLLPRPGREPVWRPYLQLPASVPARVRALARELTEGTRGPYEAALAIERYLRALRYDPFYPRLPEGRDFVDHFLFERRAGYCTAFASAAAVLLRAAGIPARYVEGFAVPLHGPGEYVVTGARAHAWVEAFIPGWGWVTLEPTPAYPGTGPSPSGGDGDLAGGGREPTPAPEPEPRVPVTPPPASGGAPGGGMGGSPGEATAPAGRPAPSAAAIAAAAVAGLGAAALLTGARRHRRLLPASPEEIRSAYAAVRPVVERLLAADGVSRRHAASWTPRELLRALHARWPGLTASLAPLTSWYEQVVYAGRCPVLARAELAAALQEWRRAMRATLGPLGPLRLRLAARRRAFSGRPLPPRARER